MPNRVLRDWTDSIGMDGMSPEAERPKFKRGHIPQELWSKVTRSPCVICGESFRNEADHIIPVCKGGTSDESNLQSLCFQCNRRKGSRLTNEQLRSAFLENREKHELENKRRRRAFGRNYWDQ